MKYMPIISNYSFQLLNSQPSHNTIINREGRTNFVTQVKDLRRDGSFEGKVQKTKLGINMTLLEMSPSWQKYFTLT